MHVRCALSRVVAGCGVAAIALVFTPVAASAQQTAPGRAKVAYGDSPPGFWFGTDSTQTPVRGPAPYRLPGISGEYGGYIGMVGNWAAWQGCGDKVIFSALNSQQANNNFTWHQAGIGTGLYWFMAGPGLDPHYNGSTSEAAAWGAAQAAQAIADAAKVKTKYPVLFADVELPGNAPGISPAPDNGWNSVYTSPCSGRTSASFIDPTVDRADLDAFFSDLTAHSTFKPGVYSAPSVWASIFGTGAPATLTNVAEWTYTANTSSLSPVPSGWCLRRSTTCAQFFGGITSASPEAVMWQWSGGGGTFNGIGDFDQIDMNRIP
ncbi:MAG TPA: hypothetical protein VGS19_02655 [Streptosporangiaceae bacterium]|nr:hypothetical protein [Streptosporangiaceae bacterium]